MTCSPKKLCQGLVIELANLYGRIVRTGVPTTFVGTTVITKVAGRAVPAIVVGTMVIVSVVPTRLVGRAVPAIVVGTTVKQVLFLLGLLERLFQ